MFDDLVPSGGDPNPSADLLALPGPAPVKQPAPAPTPAPATASKPAVAEPPAQESFGLVLAPAASTVETKSKPATSGGTGSAGGASAPTPAPAAASTTLSAEALKDLSVYRVNIDRTKVKDVLSEYEGWFSGIKFRKEWATHTFRLSDVRDHLEVAATIVVFIRAILDSINPGFKLRQTAGSSHELLWQLQQTGKLIDLRTADDCARFICPIVHWTFRDVSGYVEGLSHERVSSLIVEFKRRMRLQKQQQQMAVVQQQQLQQHQHQQMLAAQQQMMAAIASGAVVPSVVPVGPGGVIMTPPGGMQLPAMAMGMQMPIPPPSAMMQTGMPTAGFMPNAQMAGAPVQVFPPGFMPQPRY